MKLRKTASGKTELKLSKKEWEDIGVKAGWLDKSAASDPRLQWDEGDDELPMEILEELIEIEEDATLSSEIIERLVHSGDYIEPTSKLIIEKTYNDLKLSLGRLQAIMDANELEDFAEPLRMKIEEIRSKVRAGEDFGKDFEAADSPGEDVSSHDGPEGAPMFGTEEAEKLIRDNGEQEIWNRSIF
jgi:hypothetical protein